MRNLKTINELFDFLKKKFDEDEINSIVSLFRDYSDELGLSDDDIYLDIDNKSTELDITLTISALQLCDRKSIMSSDLIKNFFIKLSTYYRIVKGNDYYSGIFDKDFILDLQRQIDESFGHYKFKIKRK